MANCLLVWELGAGLGHVTVFRPLVASLVAAGHRVFVAAKDVRRAKATLGDEVSYLQAPFKQYGGSLRFASSVNHAELLANVGFDSVSGLAALVEAWRHLYRYVRPDLIVFNHSPTAMLAARGLACKRAVVGPGFEIPPDVSPYPVLRTWAPYKLDELTAMEQRMVAGVNAVLQLLNIDDPLEQLSQLYEADETVLATIPPLDHYQDHRSPSIDYVGCWPNQGGMVPKWPSGSGPKLYCYLKPADTLRDLLLALIRLNAPTIFCFDGDIGPLVNQYACDTLFITDKPLDLRLIGEQCDYAILTGSHGVTASLLLSGVPCLFLPRHLEQHVTARNMCAYGAGLVGDRKRSSHVLDQLDLLLRCPRLKESAVRFSQEYGSFRERDNVQLCNSRISELLN